MLVQDLSVLRRENFTPNCHSRVCSWHFPAGKAAGPTRFAWSEGVTLQVPDRVSHNRRKKKPMVPVCAEDEGADSHAAAAQTPSTLSFSQISSDPVKVQYLTGLPDAATVLFLEALLSRFELQYHYDWTVQCVPLIDQLLLTLMRLKLNCRHTDLGIKFNCSKATVANTFTTIIQALYDILYVGMLENNIPSTAKNQTSLPECFKPFPSCRIVLNCIKVSVFNSETLAAQSHFDSQSKRWTTLKALIGAAPNGAITFISDLYGESVSDREITADCGILQHLRPGDTVMADEGFAILPEGVSPNVSPSVSSSVVGGQFTQNNNRLISQARSRVQRSIQRLKLFSILDHIPFQFKRHMNKILKVCVCLTNLQTLILSDSG
ncbi:uncharacterized protein AKAME5_000926300 [Lates japonicus]|uniref:DDE Tnp4 domain-containing protein n=1 Tax=Lates japonicus TaxID=270547 RepID=A0AAD3MNC6_LATJO|nr:uncharacterized protein AKAME5_000926300 [Lates japonicus]